MDIDDAAPCWTLVRGGELVDSHAEAWGELNERNNGNHPLLDPKFVLPLYQHFATDRVSLAIYRRGGRPLGLALIEKVGGGRWQVFAPSQAPLGLAILPRAELRGVSTIFHVLGPLSWHVGWPCQDPLFSTFHGQDVEPALEILPHAQTTTVDVCGLFQEYWQSRPKGLQSFLRRVFRRLEAAGLPVHLSVLQQSDQMKEAIALHGQLESGGWKGPRGTAIHEENVQGHFYLAVLERFAKISGSRVYQLWLGPRLAASLLTISQNGMMVVLKTTHDETLRRFAPGRLLDYLMVQNIYHERNVKTIENYTNASTEDLRWATSTRTLFHVNCYRWPLFGPLVRTCRVVSKPITNLRLRESQAAPGLIWSFGRRRRWWYPAP